jgi:hypothetical protein
MRKLSVTQKRKLKADEWDGYASGLLSLPARRTKQGNLISKENNREWMRGNDLGISHRLLWSKITGLNAADYKLQLARDLTKDQVLSALIGEESPCDLCPAYTICKAAYMACPKFNTWARMEGNLDRFPMPPTRANFIGLVPDGI